MGIFQVCFAPGISLKAEQSGTVWFVPYRLHPYTASAACKQNHRQHLFILPQNRLVFQRDLLI